MERVVVVFGCLVVLGLVPMALGQNETIGNATSDSLTPVQMASSSILVPLQHRFTLNCSLTEPSLIPEEDLYHLQMVLYIDQINATQKLASWEKFKSNDLDLRDLSPLSTFGLTLNHSQSQASPNLTWFTFVLTPQNASAYGNYICQLNTQLRTSATADLYHSNSCPIVQAPSAPTSNSSLTSRLMTPASETATKPNTATSMKKLTWLWIAIGLGAFGAILGGVYYFYRKHSNRVDY